MQSETQTQTQTTDKPIFFSMLDQSNYQPPYLRSISKELDQFM